MFSDTHFHFHHLVEERGLDGAEILSELAERNTFFGLDIGTRSEDLENRNKIIEESISRLPSPEIQEKCRKMIFYSVGIWPDVDSIKNRVEEIKNLESQIENFSKKDKIVAIGECGLDHHWNPSGADGRREEDFDKSVYEGERELFEMQLELCKKLGLPVVVHSRDAFEETVDVLKNMDFHNGVIHCFSYDKNAARTFLDMGFYIAFGGAVTYTKKSKMPDMAELLRFVPDDRILLETDAPYLAPVPHRGKTNTPVFIEETYKFIAEARGIPAENLSLIVDENIRKLFRI